jgi:hypothetical protein
MDWAWGKEAQFQSDVVPQVGLDANSTFQIKSQLSGTNMEKNLKLQVVVEP